jgi:outer membrane protein assembly factor BamB
MVGVSMALCIALQAAAGDAPKAGTGERWPQWRGSDGSGVAGAKAPPAEWSATKNVRWKTPIPGRGHSSPVVWGGRVFLTSAVEGEVVPGAKAVKHVSDGQEFLHPDAVGADRKHSLLVLALDAATGKLLWQRSAFEGTPRDSRHRKASFASPTPATDGERVYAYFGSEGLYAYDFEGQLVWKVDLGIIGSMGVGTGTSPLIWNGLVIVLCDEDEGKHSFIVALDARTGKERWRAKRDVQVNWSTPLLVQAAGRTELVTGGSEAVIAYDPATGKELWRAKGLGSNAVPSPVASGDLVVVSTGYPNKLAMALRAGGTGDISDTPRVAWTYAKGTAYVPSPIVYGDQLYLVTDKGLLTALDMRSGKVLYEGGRVPVPATFTASPIAFDGKLLLLSEDGDGFLIKAGPTHEVLRTNALGEPIHASPAVADGRLFIRAQNHLYCIGS